MSFINSRFKVDSVVLRDQQILCFTWKASYVYLSLLKYKDEICMAEKSEPFCPNVFLLSSLLLLLLLWSNFLQECFYATFTGVFLCGSLQN